MKNTVISLEGFAVVEIGEHSETPQPFGLGRYEGIEIVHSAGGSPREDLDFAVRIPFLLAHLRQLDVIVTHSDPSGCQK